MREGDIRTSLKNKLAEDFAKTDTVIVDEMPICWGYARIDVAVIDRNFHGFEIKSEHDTLERLPRQAALYSKVFDTVTLVCCQRLISKAKDIIPDWWGIWIPVVDQDIPSGIRFEVERKPQINQQVDVRSLLELTWKREAIGILEKHGLARGFRSRPRWDIWDYIFEKIDSEEIKEYVRECIKNRKDWRSPETLQRLYAD